MRLNVRLGVRLGLAERLARGSSAPAAAAIEPPRHPVPDHALAPAADRLARALGLRTAVDVPQSVASGLGSRCGGAPVVRIECEIPFPAAARVLEGAACLGFPGYPCALDLETTGLTSDEPAALVGLLEITGPATARLWQWLLVQPDAERTVLRELETMLARRSDRVLVTHNGASFDRPRLLARARHQGIATALGVLPHLDVLQAARRLWSRDDGDHRLTTLEAQRLHRPRHGDIPGIVVAGILEQLWDGGAPSASAIGSVLEHNRLDVIATLELVPELARSLVGSDDGEAAGRAARYFVRRGAIDAAADRLEAFAGGPAGDQWIAAALELAAALRRAGRPERAAVWWARVCTRAPGHPQAHQDLAIHLERRGRDHAGALAVAVASTHPCPRRVARLQARSVAAPLPSWREVVARCLLPGPTQPL